MVLRHENGLTGYFETRALFQYGERSLNNIARLVNCFVCDFGPQKCEIHSFKACIPIVSEFCHSHVTTIFLGRYDFNKNS